MNVTDAFARFDLEQKGKAAKTSKNYLVAMNSFIACCGDLPVGLITREHVVRWKIYMDSRGNAISSMSTNLSKLRNVLNYLRSCGFAVIDPAIIKLPKVTQKEVTYLEYGEVQKIIDAAENIRDKAIIACLFSTGCRISELLNLNREDITGNSAVVTGKGHKYRQVYFDGHALRYLEEYLSNRKDKLSPLFISGQRRRITVSRVQQIIHEYTDMAGITKNVTPHVFRHSYATDLLWNGSDIMAIKGLLGHTQITTTMRYLHVTDKHKEEAYKKYHSA